MEREPFEPWPGMKRVELESLARAYGTPFFLYDADKVKGRIISVRGALAHLVKVYYAVKANPNIELLKAVRGIADGLDISSGGELEQARLAGYPMASLSFAGPAKTFDELAAAIESGVGFLSIESVRELDDCAAIAERCGAKANIMVRVNPRMLNRAFGLKMGGKAIQFGIDEEEIEVAFAVILKKARHLNFRGIHVYAGSQCFDAAAVVDGVQNTFRIALEIEKNYGVHCHMINLGGGFGVSHGSDGRELNLSILARALLPALREFHESSKQKREIVFELGRYLTADAGIYITRVVNRKNSRGKFFFVVDGGLNHHLAAAGTFGAAMRSNYQVINLSQPDAPPIRCNIAGPSCNPTDLLAIDIDLPCPEIGDLIGVLKAGSYGLSASPILFLGRQTPAELVHREGAVVLGRRPRSILEFN